MTEQVAELSTATAQPLSYADGAAWLAGEASGDFFGQSCAPRSCQTHERRASVWRGRREDAGGRP